MPYFYVIIFCVILRPCRIDCANGMWEFDHEGQFSFYQLISCRGVNYNKNKF